MQCTQTSSNTVSHHNRTCSNVLKAFDLDRQTAQLGGLVGMVSTVQHVLSAWMVGWLHLLLLLLQRRAGAKGFGLYTDEDLAAGQFVIQYVGEVLEEEEYLRRKHYYIQTGQRHYYFMNIGNGEVIDACRKVRQWAVLCSCNNAVLTWSCVPA